jgi:hypothetical protein
MVARLVDWGILRRATYRLLEVDGKLVSAARAWLAAWAKSAGFSVEDRENGLHVGGASDVDLTIEFLPRELSDYLDSESTDAPADLLIANAFLDLVDVPAMLPRLFARIASGGLFWFSINFDGETIFQPSHPDDSACLDVYHRSMDERIRYGRPAGDSKTGRHLFGHLRTTGANILAAGSSDWLVYAHGGAYPEDEAYFLDHILFTIEEELQRHPEVAPATLMNWLSHRRHQLASADLVYIAHQLDFLGRPPP